MKTLEEIKKHKKENPGFMHYHKNDEEIIIEWCPHCTMDVEIKGKAEKQICPECGEEITPCSLCDYNKVFCGNCILGGTDGNFSRF